MFILELIQGADDLFDLPIRVNGAVPEDGIAGWTFAFRLFAEREDQDEDAVLTLTSAADGGIEIFDAEACNIRLRLTVEQKADLDLGRYWFRLTSQQPNGDDDVPARGWANLSR